VSAATEIIAEAGVKAVSHRTVAKRAGVPLAATTYYFSSIQHLTEEALRRHVDARVAELTRITEQAGQGSRTIEQVALRFADALVDRDRHSVIAQYEVYLEAARTPGLRPAVAEALDAFRALAETSLRVLGAERPAEGAAAFIALIDGFELHCAARPGNPTADAAALFEAMRALFIAYSMPPEELAVWHARLRADLRAAPAASN
jgi:TetR/AcrR family transcriptional regulator, regulator of biofilm formation and stress response